MLVEVWVGGQLIVRDLPPSAHLLVFSATAVGPEPVAGHFPDRHGGVQALYPRQCQRPELDPSGQDAVHLRVHDSFATQTVTLLHAPDDLRVELFSSRHPQTLALPLGRAVSIAHLH